MRVRSLGREDLLEEDMTTCSSILAWKIPWTEEPGGLLSTGSQRIKHDSVKPQSRGAMFPSIAWLTAAKKILGRFEVRSEGRLPVNQGLPVVL